MAAVGANLIAWKVRHTDGVERQGRLTTCCNMTRWENDLLHALTRLCLPSLVEVVLKQEAVREVNHPEVMECISWMTFKVGDGGPFIHLPKRVRLIGTGNVLLIHSDENHRGCDHAINPESSYFEVTQTRIDIEVSRNWCMDEGLPPSIPFLPDLLVHHPEGALVTGMDGEFLWLDTEMQPLSPVSTPHPMRVRQATITNGHLIATWLDRELMLACMGAIPVGSTEDGHQRSELRTSIGSQTIHYPAGNAWAHALDAEPMALATDGTTVVFDLYRRGLYGIGITADEHWRMPPPNWSYPKRRPRNEETVALNILGEECWVTSRGGRVQRRSLSDGQLVEEHLLTQVEAPVEHHFKHGDHDLVCSTEGTITWLHEMKPVKQARLSGPIQSAVFDTHARGWRIAGWREEVVITRDNEQRRPTDELPVHVIVMGSGALVLYNDGSWENSPFEFNSASDD